jgi:hypothetical protein
MCRIFPDYREFYHPILDHPEWSEAMREACMREAKTTERYQHEYLAEFGSPTAGVYKGIFIDRVSDFHLHRDMKWDPSKHYVMGVDWNGEGTGTRIYIVEYDSATRKRRTVDRAVVDEEDATTVRSIAEIKRLNKKWMCDHIYVDAGFGASQDELIKLEGQMAGKGDAQTYKLKNIHKIDFGGSLTFNKLVPNREPGEKKTKESIKEDEEKRRTKPFMVEGAVMALEQELIELSIDDDKILIDQMRGYRVKTWSAHGMPASYETDSDTGDHDHDAWVLAMLGIEINYGLYHTAESVRRLSQIFHVASWGAGPVAVAAADPMLSDESAVLEDPNRRAMRNRAGIPSRAIQSPRPASRVVYGGRGMAYVARDAGGKQVGRVPSRTAFFQQANLKIPSSPFNSIATGLVFGKGMPFGKGW